MVLVNFEDHLEIVILPDAAQQNETIKEGLQRLIKLLQTFEKLGYATDPYLGNLTASPRNLGTALRLEVDFHFDSKVDADIDKDIADEIEYGKNVALVNRLADSRHSDVQLQSLQTLAPQFNEKIQIVTLLETIQLLNSIDANKSAQYQLNQDYMRPPSQQQQEEQKIQPDQDLNDGSLDA